MTQISVAKVKKPETKRENRSSQIQETDQSQSIFSHSGKILFLQRTIGNQSVGKFIRSGVLQAKLRIGRPGDKYEQEADRVAEQILRMPEVPKGTKDPDPARKNSIQRKCTRCIKEHRLGKEEEEKIVRKKEDSGPTLEVKPELESGISSIRGGQPLPESVRSLYEPRFGHDFSQVRLHTDAQAADTARAVNARAFTVGSDMVFGAGEYAQETVEGKRLAYEMTHVVQEAPFVQRSPQKKKEENMKVIGHGASESAVKVAKERMTEVLSSLRVPDAGELKDKTIELHIIPHDKKLTDLPEFASIKGRKTFDGRNYDDLRGVGGMKAGTTIRYAIAEEQVTSIPGKSSGYAIGFVVAHETGHIVEQFGLTKEQKTELKKVYDARKKTNGPWLSPDWYTSSGTGEYFAQSSSAFFGRPYSESTEDKKTYKREWLKKNDPAMHKLLSSIYK